MKTRQNKDSVRGVEQGGGTQEPGWRCGLELRLPAVVVDMSLAQRSATGVQGLWEAGHRAGGVGDAKQD